MRILSFPITFHSLYPSRYPRKERTCGKLQAAFSMAEVKIQNAEIGFTRLLALHSYLSLPTFPYCTISAIVPAPTVCPPSRMAKRNPFSIATGVISSITRLTLSPGITISVPAGNSATPVTSVVRK